MFKDKCKKSVKIQRLKDDLVFNESGIGREKKNSHPFENS